jgi:hypothetical protein
MYECGRVGQFQQVIIGFELIELPNTIHALKCLLRVCNCILKTPDPSRELLHSNLAGQCRIFLNELFHLLPSMAVVTQLFDQRSFNGEATV